MNRTRVVVYEEIKFTMEIAADDINIPENNQETHYLDIPEVDTAVIEAKLRNLILHRLGKCNNYARSRSVDSGISTQDSVTASPCEFCVEDSLRETLPRLNSADMTMLDSQSGLDFQGGTMLQRRSSNRDQSLGIQMYTSRRNKGDRTCRRSFRFSKEELSAFLPRKSFFSCHDKALKDAGYDDTPDREKRRNSRRFEKKEEGKVQTVSDIMPPDPESDEPVVPPIQVTIEVKEAQEQDDPSAGGKGNAFASKVKSSRKKMEEEYQKKEHKAVTDYLKYVQDNPGEYMDQIRRLEAAQVEAKPVQRLISTARIYQRGHHGRPRSSLVVRASHDLKARYTDPGQWQQVIREKNQALNQVFSFGKKEKKDSVHAKAAQDSEKEGKQEQEEGKTELERSKFRAEKWLKTVPTCQQMKARQVALEEVGEEDVESTQWWSSLRTCHYIRNIGLGINRRDSRSGNT